MCGPGGGLCPSPQAGAQRHNSHDKGDSPGGDDQTPSMQRQRRRAGVDHGQRRRGGVDLAPKGPAAQARS